MCGPAIADHALQENNIIDWESARTGEKESDDKAGGDKKRLCA